MSTAQQIKTSIQVLPPAEREKLIAELPGLLPKLELEGDAAWDRMIHDARPRSGLSTLPSEVAAEARRDSTAFAETSETEFERQL